MVFLANSRKRCLKSVRNDYNDKKRPRHQKTQTFPAPCFRTLAKTLLNLCPLAQSVEYRWTAHTRKPVHWIPTAACCFWAVCPWHITQPFGASASLLVHCALPYRIIWGWVTYKDKRFNWFMVLRSVQKAWQQLLGFLHSGRQRGSCHFPWLEQEDVDRGGKVLHTFK